MLFVVVVFYVFAATAGFRNGWNRISAGTVGSIQEHPSMLSLEISLPKGYDRHYIGICGAVIVAKDWALTSAQCFYTLEDAELILRAGGNSDETGGNVSSVVRVIVYPAYQQILSDFGSYPVNDLALCQVSPHFPINGMTIKPASLPPTNYEILPGLKGVTAGWGRVSENGERPRILHVAEVVTLDIEVCREYYMDFFIPSENTCTIGLQNHTGICDGDYGGPLYIDDMVVAIISWSVGCGNSEKPDVYTQVARYRDWIDFTLHSR